MQKPIKQTNPLNRAVVCSHDKKYVIQSDIIGALNYPGQQNLSSELTELRRLLAVTQRQLQASQQRVDMLEKNQACLKRKLVRLAKKCASARYFAYHDELTGLPNRSLLLDRLKQAIVQAKRQNRKVALLFIDLDKFKEINDSMGHTAGDALLQQVANRLVSCIRYGDTACRYGGDEFVILLPEIDVQESTSVVLNKIRDHLALPYVIDKKKLKVTASIGTSQYRDGEENCCDLIKQADIDMYHSKAVRKGTESVNSITQQANTRKSSTIQLILKRILRLGFQNSPSNN